MSATHIFLLAVTLMALLMLGVEAFDFFREFLRELRRYKDLRKR